MLPHPIPAALGGLGLRSRSRQTNRAIQRITRKSIRRRDRGWMKSLLSRPYGSPLKLTAGKLVAAAILGMAPLHSGAAGELPQFHADVAEAYAHYRVASSYVRTGNLDLAAIELDEMVTRWVQVQDAHSSSPPDAFSTDPHFAADLAEIQHRANAGLVALDAGDRDAAVTELTPIREILGALRQRNGLYVFSDCINDLDRAMDRLWRWRHDAPETGQTEEWAEVLHDGAVFNYFAQKCDAEAPATYRAMPTFQRLFELALSAWEAFRRGAIAQDQLTIINELRELRSATRLIFFHFG